ncbi:O-antigen ligase family protein [candidate division WOR-3 bacterium]|nr:O-antigen ligase family protein [candidate division WOR-3 bacterium]
MAFIEKSEKKFDVLIHAVLFSFLVILSLFNGSVHSFGPMILELSAISLFGFFAYYYANKNFVLFRSKYTFMLLAIALISFISAVVSDVPYTSIERWREWLAFLGLVFLTNLFLKDRIKPGVFQMFLIAFGSAQAILGIIQFSTGITVRASGTFGTYSNFYSHFLGICLLASVYLIIKDRHLRTKNEKLVLFLPVFIISTALILSGSRVILFLLFPLAFMNRSWLKRFLIILAGAAFVAAVLIILKKIGGRDMITGDPYHLTRFLIWKQSLELTLMKPIFGFGPGSFRFAALLKNFPQDFQIIRYGKCAEYAHNSYLELSVETGIISAVLFSIILFRSAKDSFRTPLKEERPGLFPFVAFWLFLICIFDTAFYPPLTEFLGALAIGFALPRNEIKLLGKTGLKIKRWIMTISALYVIWVLTSFVTELIYAKIVKDIESGKTERVVSAQSALSVVSFIDPLNPDIDYLKSFVFEYYWIKSQNTIWLQKALKHSLRSSMLERDYRRWKRTLMLAEKSGDFDLASYASEELVKLEPMNVFNLLSLAHYDKDEMKKIELAKNALSMEPRSIAAVEMAYRIGIIGEIGILSHNFDSMLSNSKDMRDTLFVSDYRFVILIAQKLYDSGYRENSDGFIKRILPAYFENEDFILSYASFLARNSMKESFTELYRLSDSVGVSGPVLDSLRRLRLVVQ